MRHLARPSLEIKRDNDVFQWYGMPRMGMCVCTRTKDDCAHLKKKNGTGLHLLKISVVNYRLLHEQAHYGGSWVSGGGCKSTEERYHALVPVSSTLKYKDHCVNS